MQSKPPSDTAPTSQNAIRRYGLPAILVLGLILFFSLGGSQWLSFATIGTYYEGLKAFVSAQLVLACLAYGFVYMLAVAFSLPVALPLTIVGGALDGKMLDKAGVEALATLPSLDELRAKLVGLVNAPAAKLARVSQAPAGKLARVIQARADQLQ